MGFWHKIGCINGAGGCSQRVIFLMQKTPCHPSSIRVGNEHRPQESNSSTCGLVPQAVSAHLCKQGHTLYLVTRTWVV